MEIVVPELGESIVEATVARWLKKEGDRVTVGEPVVELETDKVDLEVGAKEDGILVNIAHPEGADVKVGEVLGTIEAGGGAGAAESAADATPAEKMESAKDAAGQEQAEYEAQESRPGPYEAPPDPEGVPTPAKGQDVPDAIPSDREAAQPQASGGPGDRVTPVARRFAEEQGIDISKVTGSGPGARVTKEDVQRFMETGGARGGDQGEQRPAPAAPAPAAPAQQAPSARPAPAAPQPAAAPGLDGRGETRERMSRRRRTIAARLLEAQQNAAMLTTFNDVDMTAVMELRQRRRDAFLKKHGVKLGFMSFFVKAAIGALKEFPQVNAEIQGDEIVLKHYYDIGMAIGAEEGLVVPVLRDADRMTFAQIEKAIEGYVEKARSGTLSLEDLRGGTFTITNGGVFGSLLSTPILNPPQVGILGLHRIEDRPVAVDGQVVIRPMMYLALSYDHRIVDGREAVQFLVRIKELIEDPENLLLEG